LLNSQPQRDRIPYDPQSNALRVGIGKRAILAEKRRFAQLASLQFLGGLWPLTEELFHDNLNHDKPLPQGIYSGYYRFSQKNGIIISVGVPLQNCMTLLHTPEEVRDRDWPIKDFSKNAATWCGSTGRMNCTLFASAIPSTACIALRAQGVSRP